MGYHGTGYREFDRELIDKVFADGNAAFSAVPTSGYTADQKIGLALVYLSFAMTQLGDVAKYSEHNGRMLKLTQEMLLLVNDQLRYGYDTLKLDEKASPPRGSE